MQVPDEIEDDLITLKVVLEALFRIDHVEFDLRMKTKELRIQIKFDEETTEQVDIAVVKPAMLACVRELASELGLFFSINIDVISQVDLGQSKGSKKSANDLSERAARSLF